MQTLARKLLDKKEITREMIELIKASPEEAESMRQTLIYKIKVYEVEYGERFRVFVDVMEELR